MANESSPEAATEASLYADQIGGDECDLLIGGDDERVVSAINMAAPNSNNKSNKFSFLNKLLALIGGATPTQAKLQIHDHEFNLKQESWLFDRDEIVHYSRASGGAGEHNFLGEDAATDGTNERHLEQAVRIDSDGLESIGASGRLRSYGILSSISPSATTIKRRKWPANLLVLILFCSCLLASIGLLIKLNDLTQEQELFKTKTESTSRQKQLDDVSAYNAPKLKQELNAHDATRWLVSSPKCHIPIINPWHHSIASYVKVKSPLNCSQIQESYGAKPGSITYVYDNRLFVTGEAINESKVLENSKCCYKEITRGEENDDGVLVNKTCIAIDISPLKAPFSLIRVECPDLNYTNVHTFTIHDHEEEEALKRVSTGRLNERKYYNIVMVGADTISRLNGHRQLSKTLKVLKDRYETLEFFGYNKVGENTFPNLIPLLTGLTPEQLTETKCWLASNYSQETEKGDDFLDDCKYLWNYYQEIGYVTYFSEDWPKASTFNYLKQGFRKEPTSFYSRPFTLARDKLLLPPVEMGCSNCLLDRPIVEVDLDNLKTFIGEHKKVPHFAFQWINCPQHDDLNGASQIDHILRDFFKDIHELTQVDRTFVIFFSDHGYRWNNFVSTRIGHYESSLPLLSIAAPKVFIEENPKLYENLKQHQSALLTPFDMFKTLVSIRNLAMREDKQAVLSSTPMPSIDEATNQTATTTKHQGSSSNVRLSASKSAEAVTKAPAEHNNTQSLNETSTTTFRQLIPMDGIHYKQKFVSLSLLDEHNSTELDRSCIEAGIPDNYCVCHEFEKTDEKRHDVLGAAYYYVYVYLYNKIKDQTEICNRLDLELVHEAEFFDFKRIKVDKDRGRRRKRGQIDEDGNPDDDGNSKLTTTPKPDEQDDNELQIDESHYLPNREYNIRVSTVPGKGLFQEVVRFYGDGLNACQSAAKETSQTVRNSTESHEIKHESVMGMNKVCKFSIHSDSISRLNLYKDQSKCVKSNIELKKICYCK